MWKDFFKNIKGEKKEREFRDLSLLSEIKKLGTYLVSKLNPSIQTDTLKQYTRAFFSAPSDEHLEYLPELFLKFEEYLTEIDPRGSISKKQLRVQVQQKFPELVKQENLSFLFQNDIEEELFLGKFFVAYLLKDVIHLFGSAQEQFFLSAKEWVDALPTFHPSITSFHDEPLDNKRPTELLLQLSFQISEDLEKKMGMRFTQMIFDRNYNKIARQYKYLPSFPYVISLIPRKFLNTDKIGLLSNHQLAATLLNQVNYLEDLNAQLADRNEALERAKEELKKAKKETEEAFNQLEKRTKELEKSQAEQENILKALKISNEELEQFAYVASHDLQEPLRTIEGYIDLIIKEVALVQNPDLSEFIDHTVSGVTRMRKLIKDLLEYSRIGYDARQLVKIDMEVLLEVVCYNLRRIIKETKAEISINSSTNLVADKTQMMQVFQNLISNAIKFSKKSSIPKIKITCEERKTDWLCSVSDNGIGIKDEDQSQVFALFKRVASGPVFSGSGIGLAICKKIVDQYQGEIWLSSQFQKGSTIYFTIKKNHLGND